MPWSGGTFSRSNGTYTGSTTWKQTDDAGTGILSTDHDTHDQDLATGINTALAKDGQNSPTANLPMGTYRHTGVGNASARTDYAAAGQIADASLIYAGSSSGTDTITASVSPVITAYVTGQRFHFTAGGTNTGAATLNINSVGAKSIKKGKDGATALAAGDITSGGTYSVIYDGTNFQLENPGTEIGTLVSSDIGSSIQAYDALLDDIAALSDPGADSGLFWDDSAGNLAFWTPSGALSFSDTNLTVAAADDTTAGVQENAVQSEMETASSTTLTVTPGRQQYHPSAAKFWASISVSGGTPSLDASYNVTGIVDNATGNLTVTIATDFSSAAWSPSVTIMDSSTRVSSLDGSGIAAGTVIVKCFNLSGSAQDPAAWYVQGFGDQA